MCGRTFQRGKEKISKNILENVFFLHFELLLRESVLATIE
jgi:hypothetical protein